MLLVLLKANMTLFVLMEVYRCTYAACHLAAEDLKAHYQSRAS